MIDRRFIGIVSEPRMVEVEQGQLRFFAKATGETNPIYFDEGASHAAGHTALLAPPTFAFSLALAAPARRGDLFEDLGIEVGRVLHAEQGFVYHAPIYAGDRITLVTRIEDIYEKKNGALEFVVQLTTATNQNGVLCCEMRNVVVVRNPGAGS